MQSPRPPPFCAGANPHLVAGAARLTLHLVSIVVPVLYTVPDVVRAPLIQANRNTPSLSERFCIAHPTPCRIPKPIPLYALFQRQQPFAVSSRPQIAHPTTIPEYPTSIFRA
ncbi:hypothetical protein MSAN_01808000 [Mycena sanguinolenta]|uniref:Uncharacterized protein n=1 Tax=Mycena sanguinolenta TaxID=230812 RepID=A0A8H6XUM5_9AGAR|nr:hypothetical protein MSAN_01808000 [Mycena sanguinolenta]